MLTPDQKRAIVAKRIAQDLKDGYYVNLGIGIPTEVPNHVPKGIQVFIHSENGIIGMGANPEAGKENPWLINAGAKHCTEIPGAALVDSAESFAIIRGGHLDMTVLGALQVDQEGSIASWMIPGKLVPGMGGAMDLSTGAKSVVAAMEHVDKNGKSKIVKKCNLPLTAYKSLTRIVTEMAYIEVTPKGLVLKEIASWTTIDEVKKATEADLIIPDHVGCFEL